MNVKSSRSHSVFTLLLTVTEVRSKVRGQRSGNTSVYTWQVIEGEEHTKVSRINLIDLAGSERSASAHTTGERLKVRGHTLTRGAVKNCAILGVKLN